MIRVARGEVNLDRYSDVPPFNENQAYHYDAPWLEYLDWVILGGETGPGARPMNPAWVRKVRDDCQAAGVPFFFKQWGEWSEPMCTGLRFDRPSGKPYPLFIFDDGKKVVRYGKKVAGHLLDGREWRELPGVRP